MKRIALAVIAVAFSAGLGMSFATNAFAGKDRKPTCDCKDANCKCYVVQK